MAAFGVDVHLDRDTGFLQRDEVGERVFDPVYIVVFVLQQEGGRGLAVDVRADVRVELERGFGKRQVAGIDGDGKVGAAALFVGGIDGRVQAPIEVDADGGDQVSAGGESEHADLVWVNVPL